MRRHRKPVEITIQYFDGCPNWKDTCLAVAEAAREIGLSNAVMCFQPVETDEEARRIAFRGSPTILIDGTDPFAELDAPAGHVSGLPDGAWIGRPAVASPVPVGAEVGGNDPLRFHAATLKQQQIAVRMSSPSSHPI
jgi:hypothetical protein